MSFTCPRCGGAGTLVIGACLDLPGDSRSDEISVQALACLSCTLRAVAVYEESRRGRLDSENVDHRGYELSDEDAADVARQIAECPRPREESCRCKSHRRLGVVDDGGRWVGLRDVRTTGVFAMQWEPSPPPTPVPETPVWVPVHWELTGDSERIYEARVGGRHWQVRVNASPDDETVYSLRIGDDRVCQFNGWPQVWNRP